MKLIINLPQNKKELDKFNSRIAKLQKELILLDIKNSNIDYNIKKQLLLKITHKIKEKI